MTVAMESNGHRVYAGAFQIIWCFFFCYLHFNIQSKKFMVGFYFSVSNSSIVFIYIGTYI